MMKRGKREKDREAEGKRGKGEKEKESEKKRSVRSYLNNEQQEGASWRSLLGADAVCGSAHCIISIFLSPA